MSKVNLELQLKFLTQLDKALNDALLRDESGSDEKVKELHYMREEVMRAQEVVSCRINDNPGSSAKTQAKENFASLAAQ